MRIHFLNPNSSQSTTDAMITSLDQIRDRIPAELVCATLEEGPPGIERQAHVDALPFPVLERLRATPAEAHVISCFSDPGLHLCREELEVPVIGIAEAAYLEAVQLGRRFGVVSIGRASFGRHLRQIRQLGVESFLAADRALEIPVVQMNEAERVIARIVEVGTELRDRDGAGSLILGCASMGVYRPEIEARLGLPVIDPVQAAAIRAAALLALRYPRLS
ncbi:aspartate/glutamate racemase family protein [Frigidibacter sp. MR17.14]|uniref:aspartate/glutamate racemase family protein n=1 Tax=Frigidibacter sp. MR17.14 TaxID=3126509 RepID=UPI003012F55F